MRYVEVVFRGPASSSGLSAYAEGFWGEVFSPFRITDWSWLTPDKRLELFEAGFLAEFSSLPVADDGMRGPVGGFCWACFFCLLFFRTSKEK